jgi:hypothetical protein
LAVKLSAEEQEKLFLTNVHRSRNF